MAAILTTCLTSWSQQKRKIIIDQDAAGPGGTDLRVREIQSDFAFLLFGGVGAQIFLNDSMALYGGYRLVHISNGNTSRPNRGFEAHTGVGGLSFYFK